MKGNSELPLGWKRIKLGSICEFNYGKSLPKNNREHSGSFDVYGSNGVVGKHSKYLIDSPCIIVGRKGAAGEVQMSMSPCWPIDTTYYILENPNYTLKFLYYLLKSLQLSALDKSTAIPGLNRNDAYDKIIYLPPLAEQSRIVAKIEELFSNLDRGIERLKAAQQQLKIYRQSVLKWAFEGNHDWINLGNIAEIKRGKSKHRPRDAKELYGGPYPFIQTGDVRAAYGGIITKYSQTYSEMGLRQSRLWPEGTLCLTIAANIAETAFLGFDACFPDSIVGIHVDEQKHEIKYIRYYLQFIKHELDAKATATAQKNINVEFLEKIKIPIPPLPEQEAIVEKIENRLSICDKLEESIYQLLQQSEVLRQSILRKAFKGNLVP